MKRFLTLLLSLAMTFSLAACGNNGATSTPNASSGSASGDGDGKVYTLKMSYTISGNETVAQCAQAMAKTVTERTNGGVVFENYPDGQLATDTDALELCAQGANIISFGTPDFLAAYAPDLGILDGPFLFADPSEFKLIDESDWMQDMRSNLESQGIKNLGMSWYFGSRNLTYSGDKGVTTPADLKGMKIRSASSPTRVGMLEAMGATVTQMPWNEVYSALQQGVCNGCEAPLSTLYSSKIYEVCKNITLDKHIMAIWSVNMSADYFNSMPAEYQEILQEEIDNAAQVTIDRVTVDEKGFQTMLEDEGVMFYEADHDAFVEATKSVYGNISGWSDGLYDTVSAILK